MDRVVAAQTEIIRLLAGAPGETLVDPDRDQLSLKRLKGLQCLAVTSAFQTPVTLGSRQCGSSLWVGEDTRNRYVSDAPKFAGQFRAVLLDNELDQRRGVEVDGQRRCSWTRSDTEPVASIWAERGVLGDVGQ